MSIPYDPEHITYFAETDYRNVRTRFGIKARDRTRHMYVIGKSGVGKSTLLENMALQDIQRGEGVAVLDPHGSFADKMLDYVPMERIKDVVYFAPFDTEYPISFNVLEDVGHDKRHLVVSGLISAFKKIWVDAWSARMEYILTNTLLALLEYPGATLLGVNRMLSDKAFRTKVVENVTDPSVKAFWVEEFAKYTERMAAEAVPAIQNKIGQFTANPLVRNIIGQPKSSFDIRKLMDEQKILIINLSKGRIGDTNTNLMGSMIITKIYLAAMSRAELSNERVGALPNFYFYVDEFQSFANETFADILAEARKYKLALIIAHQYVAQMEEKVRDAVFGNVGTTVSFRVGPLDAELLEKVFAPQFTQNDLINLGMAEIYLSLMINDIGSQPFSAKTLPPIPRPAITFRNDVIEQSRASFAQPKEQVETDTRDWFTQDTQPVEPPKQRVQYGDNKPPRESFAPRAEGSGERVYTPRPPRTDTASPYPKTNQKPFQKTAEVHKPFQKVFPVAPLPAEPLPSIAPLPRVVQEEKPTSISPALTTLLDALDADTRTTSAPQPNTFVPSTPTPTSQTPFDGEKTLKEHLQPVKIQERGPSEKNRDLLRAALEKAGASAATSQLKTPPPPATTSTASAHAVPSPAPAPASVPPAKATNNEVSLQELRKILE